LFGRGNVCGEYVQGGLSYAVNFTGVKFFHGGKNIWDTRGPGGQQRCGRSRHSTLLSFLASHSIAARQVRVGDRQTNKQAQANRKTVPSRKAPGLITGK